MSNIEQHKWEDENIITNKADSASISIGVDYVKHKPMANGRIYREDAIAIATHFGLLGHEEEKVWICWLNDREYYAGDRVIHAGRYYISIMGGTQDNQNINREPNENRVYWTEYRLVNIESKQ